MDVAQLVRASLCGSEGRGFKSRHPPFGLTCECSTEKIISKKRVIGNNIGFYADVVFIYLVYSLLNDILISNINLV